MQEYLQRLREMKEEARAGLDRQAEIYARISAELRRAEAIAGRQANGDNGNGDGNGEGNGNGRPRDNIVLGPWGAVAGAATLTARALFGNARRAVATITSAAVIAGGIALAVTETPHQPPSHGALPARPPAATPPGPHTSPRPGPPRPPKAPAPPAAPEPIGQPAVFQPPTSAAPYPRHTPPRKRPPAKGRPTAPPSDPASGTGHHRDACRLHLPRLLHRGLLCGHPLQRLGAAIWPQT
jgi:hypothetical protein